MQFSEHAQTRLKERQIDHSQVELVLEYGEWNARGDRLTLNERDLKNLIADRRRSLRRIERGQSNHRNHTPQSDDRRG